MPWGAGTAPGTPKRYSAEASFHLIIFCGLGVPVRVQAVTRYIATFDFQNGRRFVRSELAKS
jgi:hypothetical protein